MTNDQMERRLSAALDKTAPDDVDGVLSRCTERKGTVVPMKKKNNRMKKWMQAVAACLAVLLLGGGGLLVQQAHAVTSVVSLDVNPSIELRVNSREKVVSCQALNQEAQAVLEDMDGGRDLKGVKADVAVNAIVGSLVRCGYLDSLSSAILISVEDKDQARAQRLQQELTGSEWNTISYTPARRLSVQTLDNGMTAMDFRLAAQPASPAVERSSFSDVSFLGDSLTQGMQLYEEGMQNAMFCAYKGVGPNVIVNGTTCKRADGTTEVPLEALTAQNPRAVYLLLGTNVLGRDTDYSSFLTYYRLMLDMISQALPNTKIYVQSITPVRPEVSKKSPGLYKERLCEINDALSAIALEKGCTFLNLWEALADENGDLIEEYAQPDGYHLLPAGYDAWVDYLCTHT